MAMCKACEQPLLLELDPEDFDEATSSVAGGQPSTVPDDVELPCQCHFHWQCLLDDSPTVATSLACPSCNAPLTSTISGPSASNFILPRPDQEPQLLVRYTNEGGIQPSLDILPLITEEAYLDAHPAARPARAYLTMCSEGDIGGVVELLQSLSQENDDDEQPVISPAELLRYQDPLNANMSGLHLAVAKGQMEIVWLLLWVASGLRNGSFPTQAINAALQMGAGRDVAAQGGDIRGLKNDRGETAGSIAERIGGSMLELVRAGVL